jgi:flavin reductase (DIM6/NTAB) family NADH-FMN oxidoreductase RutF
MTERSSTQDSFIDPDSFREAMARWPAGVAIVACRDGARPVATTVSAFISLSVDPPLVLIALGPNATVRPFLSVGAAFGISVLGLEQRRLASVFADPYPVGPDPFTADGVPTIVDAPAALECRVTEVRSGGDHAVLIAAVTAAAFGQGEPLVRVNRTYRGLRP